MSPRRISQAQLEGVSALRPGFCLQARVIGRLFPDGIDLEAAASADAWAIARRHKLDIVFAACSVGEPEELAEFRGFCLRQLGDLLPSGRHPGVILRDERPGSALHRCAHWYLEYAAKPVTGDNCYSVSVAARKATRAGQGKDAERLVYEAQLDWWERKHRRLLAGEQPPILGDLQHE